MGSPSLVLDGPGDAAMTIALAHGAGAPMDSPFMVTMAAGLTQTGLRVARFEFPYMARRREDGKRRPPDRQPVLIETWRAVVESLGHDRLIVGGKSMGGRMASLLAAELEDEGQPPAGLVALGYPFHPPGKPDRLRVDHLQALRTPSLFLQGERDPFGRREEVGGYPLSEAIRLHWIPDGDHGFKPRKASGRTELQNREEAIEAIASFAQSLAS